MAQNLSTGKEDGACLIVAAVKKAKIDVADGTFDPLLNDEFSHRLQECTAKIARFFDIRRHMQALRPAQINQPLVGRFDNDRKSQVAKLLQIGYAANYDAARNWQSMPLRKFMKSRLVIEDFYCVPGRKLEPVGVF